MDCSELMCDLLWKKNFTLGDDDFVNVKYVTEGKAFVHFVAALSLAEPRLWSETQQGSRQVQSMKCA